MKKWEIAKGKGMVEHISDWIERLLALLFVPATLYGGCGALMRRRKDSRTLRQRISEVGGGALTAHMLTQIIQDMTPEAWHAVCFFLAGWGGLELVGRLYEAIADGVAERLRRRISQWPNDT